MDYLTLTPEDAWQQLAQVESIHARISANPNAPRREEQLQKLEAKHAAILEANPDLTAASSEAQAAAALKAQAEDQKIEQAQREILQAAANLSKLDVEPEDVLARDPDAVLRVIE